MFVDFVNITIASGKGGNGIVAFRREKFVPKGNPNGGNGGKGGNIIFIGDKNLHTLLDFTYHRIFAAEEGEDGKKNDMTGKSGKHTTVPVPLGTLLKDNDTGETIADITDDVTPVTILIGGRGGLGNRNFKTSTNQAPTYCNPGVKGETRSINLELKVMADVGLVGFPNAGKSTLLSVISNAKPKIADYPFTTLVPNLGIIKYENYKSFVMADIPGLIEGASDGKGIGLQFLRHIERTRILLYMINADSEDYEQDFKTLKNEVDNYKEILDNKPIIKVLTKSDLLEKGRDTSFFDIEISSFSLLGTEELKNLIVEKIKELDTPVW